MKVAIVISNWNGRSMMEQYLPSVLNYSRDEAEIIIADNVSTDDSAAWLKETYSHVRAIESAKNYDFAEGYNRALKQVDSEYYVLLNSDVEMMHRWLTPLIEEMDVHKDIAACQPKLLPAANPDAFEYVGASGGFIDRYGYPFCRGRIFDTVEDDNGQYNNSEEVLWATGACLMIRAIDYRAAGGLDGRFFTYNEGIGLCWRLHQMGKRIFYFPENYAYHIGGGTLPKSNSRKIFLNFHNDLTMLWKDLPEGELKHVMRVRRFLGYLAALQTLILDHSWSEFKAVFSTRRTFKKWRHEFERSPIRLDGAVKHRKNLPPCTNDGRKKYTLLWQYYVKGRKVFSSLTE